jgi:hypothetical protein
MLKATKEVIKKIKYETPLKEHIVSYLYPDAIRNQIRKELIEQQILEAREFCFMCWLVEDMESLEFFYTSMLNWQSILENIKKMEN